MRVDWIIEVIVITVMSFAMFMGAYKLGQHDGAQEARDDCAEVIGGGRS
jgi:hypothetical protein